MLGSVLADRYRVLRQLGQGGMGVVYEAEHVQLGKKVAIKLLLAKFADDPEAIARFQREALTVSQIGNPHIIDVVDIGVAPDGRSFVVLELLTGADLGVVLSRTGPMNPQRAIAIMQQVLQGVGAAHARGIVHRDLKPDNVFLVQRGTNVDFVKILDFGISKILDAVDAKVRLTSTGTVVGTPIYMAPEQAMGGAIDHRADLYALGIMFYEMLAGRPPFDAPSYIALVTKHLHEEPPPLKQFRPDLPNWLTAVVHRALEKEPDRRFASADAFLAALPSKSALMATDNVATLSPGQVPALPQLGTGKNQAHRKSTSSTSAASAVTISTSRASRLPWIILAFATVAAATALTILVATKRNEPAPAAPAHVASALPTPVQAPGVASGNGEGSAAGPAAWADPARAAIIATPIASEGELQISTLPVGATVFVDDQKIGVTPIEDYEVAPGQHTIRLELAGYAIVETPQKIAAGDTLTLVVPMAASATTTGGQRAATKPTITVERQIGRRKNRSRDKFSGPGSGSGSGAGSARVPNPMIKPDPKPDPVEPDNKVNPFTKDGRGKANPFGNP